MTITVSLFVISVLVFIANTILDHLFNWGFRSVKYYEEDLQLTILYMIKTAFVIAFLYWLTNLQK